MANGDGQSVRPDHQTKLVGGILYSFTMAVILFLCGQVWSLNSDVSKLLEKGESQQRWNQRMERLFENLDSKVDKIDDKVNKGKNGG